jgi:hypothetical protein
MSKDVNETRSEDKQISHLEQIMKAIQRKLKQSFEKITFSRFSSGFKTIQTLKPQIELIQRDISETKIMC